MVAGKAPMLLFFAIKLWLSLCVKHVDWISLGCFGYCHAKKQCCRNSQATKAVCQQNQKLIALSLSMVVTRPVVPTGIGCIYRINAILLKGIFPWWHSFIDPVQTFCFFKTADFMLRRESSYCLTECKMDISVRFLSCLLKGNVLMVYN